ncbi:acid shock protein precursor, partial [Raoultella planticola]
MYISLHADTKHSRKARKERHIVLSTAPQWGSLKNNFEDIRMKKVLALVVAAAMGLSSAA